MQKMKCCPDECPKAGDVFVCDDCKHTVAVLRDCACADCECTALACCGKPMTKANRSPEMDWLESLDALLVSVAYRRSGQAGSVEIGPPDDRVPVRLVAKAGNLTVTVDSKDQTFKPDQITEAIVAYTSAVEGYA